MKKLIAVLLCAVMILSTLPVLTLTASAAGEGDWDTFRKATGYADPNNYKAAPGYKYTKEGFQTVNASYKGTTPYFTAGTKEAWNLKDGIHIEYRVDYFAYKGDLGEADEWMAFSFMTEKLMAPGSTEYGGGFIALIRGEGEGQAVAQTHWTQPKTEDDPGSFEQIDDIGITAERDDNGSEHYTLDVSWDGSDYTIKINGTVIAANAAISANLKDLSPNGDYYIGITMHCGVADSKAGLTILNFNGSVPTGTDSKEPEVNIMETAPIADPNTVPAGQPAMIWNAEKTSFTSDPTGTNLLLTAKGDNSYHCKAGASTAYFSWGIKPSVSYAADDFPVFAMLLRDYMGTAGNLYYCAGDVMTAQDSCIVGWSVYDEYNEFMGEDDEYCIVIMDLTGLWFDRINALTPVFTGVDYGTEDGEWDIMWCGMFRSCDEALAYAEAQVGTPEDPDETQPDDPAETEEPGVDTEAPGEDTDAPDETKAPDDTAAPGDDTEAPTEAPAGDDTQAPAGDDTAAEETKAEEDKGGCASVIGAAALILTAMAAAVALKKHN